MRQIETYRFFFYSVGKKNLEAYLPKIQSVGVSECQHLEAYLQKMQSVGVSGCL